ncbi:MAG: bpX6 domain-containing protein [Deltaproteobacteria bacterium]|nr:bpX6 domain-containing protein [Deltaproteobacteria bacterium]
MTTFSLRLRHTIHQGSVVASGVAIPTGLVGEAAARSRALALAATGSDVFRVGGALVVAFGKPRRVTCSGCLGAPLVRSGRVLSEAPLAADESAAAQGVGETVLLVSGGVASLHPLNDEARQDVARWLDASPFAVLDVNSLGRVPREPTLVLAAATPARDAYGVAAITDGGVELAQSLALHAATSHEPGTVARDASRVAASAAAVLSELWRFLGSIFQSRRGQTASADRSSSTGTPRGDQAPNAAAPGKNRIAEQLRGLVTRALIAARLAPLLGRRHAAYLRQMLEMFDSTERESLDRALRHAIPLNADPAIAPKPPALGLPSPRQDFAIVPMRGPSETSWGLGDSLFDVLRQRYRRAFERLEMLGEIEKAAFVLAELLNAHEEAVAFLEKHKRLRLAAEIAEARKLPIDLVIRLWFLAGDRERAVLLARTNGAFAVAVTRLEQRHPDEARAFRLLWGDSLASAGAYAAAVDVVWPMPDARRLGLHWLECAIEVGGVVGARMLARKLVLQPTAFVEVRDRALTVFASDDDHGTLVRAFAAELLAAPMTEEGSVLARVSARQLLSLPAGKDVDGLIDRLLDASGDALLRADARGDPLSRRATPTAEELRHRSTPLHILLPETDRGATPIVDAALLPDGRMLVALGELGVWLLSARGKVLLRFVEPTSRIILSDLGDRAILLCARGETTKLSRLDLVTKTLRFWCDAQFDACSTDFDGSTWFVARGGTVFAIDATAKGWDCLWRVTEADATVQGLRRSAATGHPHPGSAGQSGSAGSLTAWFARKDDGDELWVYETPSMTLRHRHALRGGGPPVATGAPSSAGAFVGWQRRTPPESGWGARFFLHGRWQDLPVSPSHAPTTEVALSTDWIVVSGLAPQPSTSPITHETATLHIVDAKELRLRAQVVFGGARRTVGFRMQGEQLIAFDGAGRVVVMALTTGTLVKNHRVA